eukprot:CAMPEP_0175990564 /NCGR_PEP_ID=MMETSP0108-20121206/52374_1 /TAXON_ID=195067 ORGANISM="Goniomonas pacifica, Strain CCMP1869" /NCGR_SAMPLE_ID=MMETSP0108 /ASSEMBLY_ACC=CAM_ASM_000204 /LENGTH=261 /DNA_ID=CAMNT_0017322045 /DNA_START=1 /DNA_END=783 /DNA_ORIENTATION=+
MGGMPFGNLIMPSMHGGGYGNGYGGGIGDRGRAEPRGGDPDSPHVDIKGNPATAALFIDGLPAQMSDSELQQLFSYQGVSAGIRFCKVGTKPLGPGETRTAIVEFDAIDLAVAARMRMKGYKEDGWPDDRGILVNFRKPTQVRGPAAGQQYGQQAQQLGQLVQQFAQQQFQPQQQFQQQFQQAFQPQFQQQQQQQFGQQQFGQQQFGHGGFDPYSGQAYGGMGPGMTGHDGAYGDQMGAYGEQMGGTDSNLATRSTNNNPP